MTAHPNSAATENDVILGRLLDEVTERAARGETIDLEAFLREHAAHTAGLQELLPALQALCRLGRTPSAASGISSAAYEAAAAWTLPSGTLGDFRLLQELGRGGMGVVYAAEQISLDRPVAVKVLPLAALLSETQMQRFKNEARAAAMLHHPHIVGVHTVGCERGIHFYAMELVRGRTLAEVIRDLRPAQAPSGAQPAPTASPTSAETRAQAASSTFRGRPKLEHARYVARLGQQAAEALEYAHQQGIVHRDIKPSNLMVDDQGRLRITDFGLAHMTGGHDLTMTGDVVGTLRYMSPEQAAGRPVVDPRVDVYSLGITLYELLTLRPAFEAVDRRHLLRDVLEASPPRPRQLDPSIPADLETIVLKAVAKEPADRYATARELGEDLGRFLEHRPIRARPLGRLARGWRWCQRNPAIAALASAVVCLAVLVSVASPWIAFRQSSLAKGYRRQLDVADLNVAYQEWNSGNVGMVQTILERHPIAQSKDTAASFPWRHLSWEYERSQATIVGRHDGGATAVAAAPSGSLVASGGRDGLIVFTDLETRKTVRRWRAHELGVESLAFGPDGSWLASSGGDRMVKIWNVQHETKLLKSLPCDALAKAVAVSPDGRRVVAGTDAGKLLAWSAAGEPLWTRAIDPYRLNDAEFSPDGTWVAVAGEGNNVQVLRADNGELVRAFEDLKLNAFAVAFSRDGHQLLTSTADGARVWDVRSGQVLPGFQHWMTSGPAMAVSQSGLLATGGHDRVLQLWDTYTGRRLATFAAHHDLVSGVAFTPDGRQVVSASLDGTVRVFDVRDILPGPQGSSQQGHIVWGDRLIFSAYEPSRGWELWISDGTDPGTYPLADVNAGPSGSDPSALAVLDDRLYFAANDGQHGREPWTSDGTSFGTQMLGDLGQFTLPSDPAWLTTIGTQVYFAANDGQHGRRLWRYDADTGATSLVSDVPLDPSNLLDVNGTLYFTAWDQDHGYEPWQSDGTAKGTRLVADVLPGSQSASPGTLVNLDGAVYFSAWDAAHGREPWWLPAMPGDTNGDRVIDLTDFATVKTHFGGPGARREGDLTGDGLVDLADFGLLKENFGEPGAAPRAAQQPVATLRTTPYDADAARIAVAIDAAFGEEEEDEWRMT